MRSPLLAGRGTGLRPALTSLLRAGRRGRIPRVCTARYRVPNSVPKIASRRGSDRMPAFLTPRHFDGWPRLAADQAARHFVEGEVRARQALGLARGCRVARPPSDPRPGPGAPAALPGGRDPGHRVRRPHREPGARAAPPRRGQRPDRAGGRATRGRPGGDQHRDRRGRRDRPRGPVRRPRPADRRAHRVQPPDGHRHRLQGAGRRRASLLLRRQPHGAVRRQGVPDLPGGLHDVRGRDPRLVGPPRLGHGLSRRLHVGDQRLVLGLEGPARPLHPLLRDQPPQGPPQRAPGADLREQRARRGSSVRQPIYFVLSDSQDLTLSPAYFEKRGFGIGATYRYVRREGSRGRARAGSTSTTRRTRRTTTPTAGWRASGTRRSSPRGWSSRRTSPASATTRSSPSSATRSTSGAGSASIRTSRSPSAGRSGTSSGRLFFYQDLTTDEPIELLRLPELRLNAFQQPIPGLPGLLFELDTSYINFVRDIGSDGQRLDLAPRLFYPVSPGGFFTITPRVGLRETIYDTKVVGTKEDRGFIVEDTRKELTVRSLFEAGADFDARAQRVFDLDGALGIQKLQHVIEPRVSYNFLDGDDSDDLPQWDGIDTIRPGHTVTYSLTNRLKARAVGEEDRPGRVWELIRFTLSQTYTIEPDPIVTTVVGTPAPPPTTHHHDRGGAAAKACVRRPSRCRRPRPLSVTPKRLSDVVADLILEPALRRPVPGHGVLRPVRVPRHGGHDRLLLRGGALARRLRHAPRRRRPARLHPGLARGQDRDSAGPSGSRATTTSTPAPSSRTASRSTSASSAGASPRPSSTGSTRTSSGSASTCWSWGSTASGGHSPASQ